MRKSASNKLARVAEIKLDEKYKNNIKKNNKFEKRKYSNSLD